MDSPNTYIAAFAGMLIGAILFGLPGIFNTASKYKSAAIERGYAQYSPTTGEWGWK